MHKQRSRQTVAAVAVLACVLTLPAAAQAGMPSFNLTDVGRMRFSALSFFLVGFLASAWGIQQLWNLLQRDFPRLPRLTFRTATGVVFLWGMLFVLVLTMISGARELMTPGAWEKQGLTYKLSDRDQVRAESPSHDMLPLRREQGIQKLHAALLNYAARHEGRFPLETDLAAIDAQVWNLPDPIGTRYLYVPGRSVNGVSNILAYEPLVHDDPQLVLWTDGRMQAMSVSELKRALDAGSTP